MNNRRAFIVGIKSINLSKMRLDFLKHINLGGLFYLQEILKI